ncbi:MAG: glycerol-3-phosphate dehydrogenase/oxidase [Pirellulaceae bacterium]
MQPRDKCVLVLGAGVNGAAVARHLALCDVPVCVVDAADIASGATSASSRLIHGGLRYLEYGDFALVRESLEERRRLLRLAPHFVHPLRLYVPVSSRLGGLTSSARRFLGFKASGDGPPQPRGLWLVDAGLTLYDRYAADESVPSHSTHTVGEEGVPPVDPQRYTWMCAYSDAQITFPERFTITLLQEARRHAEANRTWFRVLTYHRASLKGGRVEVRPMGAADDAPPALQVEPAAIVNATGAWVDHTLARLSITSPRKMGGTKGSHLMTFQPNLRECLQGQGVYTEAEDGRPVFILPWAGGVLVGTTDLPFAGDPRDAVASDEEITYLIAAANRVFPQAALTRGDVDSYYCGVRPLPYEDKASTAAISRSHRIDVQQDSPLPIFSLVGGKLTTARALAEETTELVLQKLRIETRCNTRHRPFSGGEDYPNSAEQLTHTQRRIADATGFSIDQVQALWPLCGMCAAELLASAGDEDMGAGLDNVRGTQLPVRAVRRIIQSEWVHGLDDLVERRLMLLFAPTLSRRTLVHLAELLVESRVLATSEIMREVDALVIRLAERNGKHVEGGQPTPGRE